ncbi:MAG: hypothetical protein ACRC53_02080 [Plesiomonas sp.]|uniref:hypothetical protein n=1 Tax=Plesiomonas sp. TaxID=2486279 RepID=UPI003F400D73
MTIKLSTSLRTSFVVSLFVLTSFSAFAKCDMQKAVRNEVLDKTLGVSSKCTPQKAIKKEIDNTLGISEKKESLNDTKESINHTAEQIKQQTNSVKNSYNTLSNTLEKK